MGGDSQTTYGLSIIRGLLQRDISRALYQLVVVSTSDQTSVDVLNLSGHNPAVTT